ncbi:hypothetical protein [Idiomarina tyrosinivorans]|uniref:hypothetical protein n=1 Tax=Idiomarina tyrosinivorans TaxID=1445662 RepID=UPI000F864F9C|nr:hypothetical protein [Idiomarina tyrosinivorans]
MKRWFSSKKTEQRLAALAILDGQVKLMVAELRNERLALMINDAVAVADGALPHEYALAIEQLLKHYQRYLSSSTPLQVVLAHRWYQALNIPRPQVPAAELAASLKYALRDLVAWAPDEMVCDYYELPVQSAGQDNIAVVVAEKSLLKLWAESISNYSVSIAGISTEELFAAKFFTVENKPNLTLWQADNQPMLLQVASNKGLLVSRYLRQFSNARAQQGDNLTDLIDNLAVEVQRSMDFHESQLKQAPIAKIRIAIDHPQIEQVAQQLQQQIGVTTVVERLPDWSLELADPRYSDNLLIGALTQLTEQPLQESNG